MKAEELNSYHKNPRKMKGKMNDLLESSLAEYGDLSGIVFNQRTKELVGGHQRTRLLKEDSSIEMVEEFSPAKEDGTVGYGFLVRNGQKFALRLVDWDETKHARANVIANKIKGDWDMDILANQFDMEDLKLAGFEPIELGVEENLHKNEVDVDNYNNQLETYLGGSIKQIVLYFKQEEYDKLIPELEVMMREMSVQSHSELFLELVKRHGLRDIATE